MSIRKLILNQAGLLGVTKDELKKIVICHVTAENGSRLRDQSGPCQHPFHHEDQGEKKN